jgi:hypothetical protein
MPTHWCANFDHPDVLAHGLSHDTWLMQYQYEHGGFDYQGNRRQKARTTAIWKSLTEIAVGDWILAYLTGNNFFAVGKVRRTKRFANKSNTTIHTDEVARTVKELCHLHFDGIVRYPDAPAFYEDFTDQWSLPSVESHEKVPASYPYAQRIDVVQWENVVGGGLRLPGLAAAAKFPEYRKPIFEIDARFFARVRAELSAASDKM